MKTTTSEKHFWQRGSSLLEFIFVAPIIVVTGGATLDVARFAQTQQITSFISQQTTSLIYRECLDKTVYLPATTNTISPWIDVNNTQRAMLNCIQQIQVGQQAMLTEGAPGAAILPSGFRILGTTPALSTCALGGTLQSALPPAAESADGRSSSPGTPTGQPLKGRFTDNSLLTWQYGRAKAVWRDHPSLLIRKTESVGNVVKIPRRGGAVVSVDACQRRRMVVVEVTYAFEPFVKFLPNFITGWQINQDGEMRETTVL